MTQNIGKKDVFTVVVRRGERYEFPECTRYNTTGSGSSLRLYDGDGEKIAVFIRDAVEAYGWSV